MSVEQIEKQLLELPREARREFAQWFYHHEDELVGAELDAGISAADRAEICRRRDELLANPGLAIPVTDEWFEELKRKLTDAPARQASPR